MEKLLLGCDWGTSSFRLRLFDHATLRVIAEVVSEEGIARMHSGWQERNNDGDNISKLEFYREFLKKQVEKISVNSGVDLQRISIIISGMASSTIGMEEVSYARLPFALDGSQTVSKRIAADNVFTNEIILVSGIQSDNDVMRGEETQLLGLLQLLQNAGIKPEEGILIFPGTHSKHIRINANEIAGFETFMTGELFNIVSKYSILKNSVETDDPARLSDTDADAFVRGIKKSSATGILHNLFTVRTNQLFDKLNKVENGWYLSGLLVGEELSYLIKTEGVPLVLCTGSNLAPFYHLAIHALGLSSRTTVVSFDLVDKAAMAGQSLLFNTLIK